MFHNSDSLLLQYPSFPSVLFWNLKRETRVVDRMGFEPTTFAGNYFLTQCECVIQTKLDDRSNDSTKRRVFLSLGGSEYIVITLTFSTDKKILVMSLQEFDALIDRMKLAYEYAENLGQYVEAAKIIYQMNDQLPDDLQLILEDLENPDSAKSFIIKYNNELKSAIVNYRQRLMDF